MENGVEEEEFEGYHERRIMPSRMDRLRRKLTEDFRFSGSMTFCPCRIVTITQKKVS